MIQKALLAIFAMIASVIMNFVPSAHAATIVPQMGWYDELNAKYHFDYAPTKAEAQAWATNQGGRKIYAVVNNYTDSGVAATQGVNQLVLQSVDPKYDMITYYARQATDSTSAFIDGWKFNATTLKWDYTDEISTKPFLRYVKYSRFALSTDYTADIGTPRYTPTVGSAEWNNGSTLFKNKNFGLTTNVGYLNYQDTNIYGTQLSAPLWSPWIDPIDITGAVNNGTPIYPNSYTASIDDITTTTATLNISKENAYYHVRIGTIDPNFTPTFQWLNSSDFSGESIVQPITGLSKGYQYTVYIEGTNVYDPNWSANERERPFTFNTPQNDDQSIQVSSGSTNWNIAGTTNFTVADIKVSIKGYSSAKAKMNGTEIASSLVPGDNVLSVSTFQNLVKVNTNNDLVITVNQNGVDIPYKYYFVVVDTNVPPSNGGGGGSGELPIQPSAPDSSWDLIGWIKYLLDWVVYVVKTATYVLAKLGTSITDIMSGFEGFKLVLNSLFSFLPPEINTLIIVAITASIILRFFGR